jgi:hypothetical protein
VPNLDFEIWQNYASGEIPTGWMTSDSLSVALGEGNNVTKGNDPYHGSFSIHLRSVVTGFGISGPGVATNGIITLSGTEFVFSGGNPDTTRYQQLSGQFKYSPMHPNDAGLIRVYLLRDSSGTKDTIADGTHEFTGTVASYTPFTLNLAYRDYINNPDTILVIIQSSRNINDPFLAENTELVIDSLNFGGWVGIEERDDNIVNLSIYPNPVSERLQIDIELKRSEEISMQLYDERGRVVLQSPLKRGKDEVDVSGLAEGNYILRIAGRQRSLYSGGVTIAR